MPSLFRRLTDAALAELKIDGVILDVGGDVRSGYRRALGGEHRFVTLNFSPQTQPDILFDLASGSWPTPTRTYDAVLLINLLEHLYDYRQALKESGRVLKADGLIVIVVPFLHAVHPSPHDYFRYTAEALERLLTESGFVGVKVTALGRGAWSAAAALPGRLLPSTLARLGEAAAALLDLISRRLAFWLGKKYTGTEYPLGYLVVARKGQN